MRYFEIVSGFRLPVSGEEQDLIDRITEEGRIEPSALDERDGELARQMVSRGLLKPTKHDGKRFYALNDASDLWRY